jgi:hypothetical protein
MLLAPFALRRFLVTLAHCGFYWLHPILPRCTTIVFEGKLLGQQGFEGAADCEK